MGSKGFQNFKTPRHVTEGYTPNRRTENSVESIRENEINVGYNTMKLNSPNPAKIQNHSALDK